MTESDEIVALRSKDDLNDHEQADLVQLRSDSSTKWKILLYGCISWVSVFHTTFCVSAIQEDMSNLLFLTDVEFSLLSTVILAFTAMIAAPFATKIVNRFLNESIYNGVIFGNVQIFIAQVMFVVIMFVSTKINNKYTVLSFLFLTRTIAGFGVGINFSNLNSLQAIWFAKSEYVTMAAQIMDLSIEAGVSIAKYTYIAIYNINNDMYQPFLISVGLSICAILGSIVAQRDEINFIEYVKTSFGGDITLDTKYTRSDDNDNGNDNNRYDDDSSIIGTMRTLCDGNQLNNNLTLLWICMVSFGISVGFYTTIYSQTEVSFSDKYNLTDYEAEIMLATLPLCKIVTAPLSGWINSKLIVSASQDEISSQKDIDKKTVRIFAIACLIGSVLFIICGLIYIFSNQENNSNGLSITAPWIFIVCYSFGDSIYFGSADSMIYFLTPTQYTSLFNSISAMLSYFFTGAITCLFEVVIQFGSYDLAWVFISLLIFVSTILQTIIISLLDFV